jgi:hypothetical protein
MPPIMVTRAYEIRIAEPPHRPDAAARMLIQIANASEAVQDGRIYIELINSPFLKEGGTPGSVPRSPCARSSLAGWCCQFGTYVRFTQAGAGPFCLMPWWRVRGPDHPCQHGPSHLQLIAN